VIVRDPATDYDRLINLRDLGGLATTGGGRTRSGVLLRSDSLVYASDADVHHLRHVVGLRTIVDLREADQAAAMGRGPLDGGDAGVATIGYVSLPCHDRGVTPDTRHLYYADLLERYGRHFAGLVRRIAADDAVPVLVHCQLGCDRTGTVIAMLLRLAGVRDEEICADYARSVGAAPGIQARDVASRRLRGEEPLDDAEYAAWANRPEIMAETLAMVDAKWGSMRGWAGAHGLDDHLIDAWTAVLVEG
jgi:protein-tyrosine phosphatase